VCSAEQVDYWVTRTASLMTPLPRVSQHHAAGCEGLLSCFEEIIHALCAGGLHSHAGAALAALQLQRLRPSDERFLKPRVGPMTQDAVFLYQPDSLRPLKNLVVSAPGRGNFRPTRAVSVQLLCGDSSDKDGAQARGWGTTFPWAQLAEGMKLLRSSEWRSAMMHVATSVAAAAAAAPRGVLVAGAAKRRAAPVKIRGFPRGCANIAHRGYSAVAPENTLASIRSAIEAGADAVEFDIHLTADRIPVLMHDETLDRTTNGKGPVRNWRLEDIQRLDAGSWMGEEHAGEPVPTLGRALDLIRRSGVQAVCELKEKDSAREAVQAIRGAGMLEHTVVIAFDDEAIAQVHALEPRLQCALLEHYRLESGCDVELAASLATRAKACGATFLDLNYELLSVDLIAELHQRNIPFWCYTVEEEHSMDSLVWLGAAGITTNSPNVLRQRLDLAKRPSQSLFRKAFLPQ